MDETSRLFSELILLLCERYLFNFRVDTVVALLKIKFHRYNDAETIFYVSSIVIAKFSFVFYLRGSNAV